MSDTVGFKFIPAPQGSALSDEGFLTSAISRQAEKDHQSQIMAASALTLAICGVAILYLSLRRRWK